MHHQKILIIDFGSQFTQLIARRVRALKAYCEIIPWDRAAAVLDAWQTDASLRGIILSGGPNSVADDETPRAPEAVFSSGVPVLGICYGMQTMAAQLGGRVTPSQHREFGFAQVRARGHTALLRDIQDRITEQGHGMLDVWMSHGDGVDTMPPGFKLMGSSDNCPIAAIADETRRLYGIQWHPEVTHTVQGQAILQRFVIDICGIAGDWTMPGFIDEAVATIRAQVGSDHVILGLSGGVDSSVAATLIHRAIGQQLTCVFVDHGLLRLNEAAQVMSTFAEHMGLNIIHVDAGERFLSKLAGVSDPEAKRKIIGAEFVAVFQEQAERIADAKWLAQGTIYPDVIESAGGKGKGAHKIKSHHNVGGLPDTLKLSLLEPMRELFKDEVRELGIAMGLPPAMVYRHPFPGPGLGVRILGEIMPGMADTLRAADAIFIDELQRTSGPDGKSWYELTAQAFAVFLPVRSVGVMGDGRTYEHVIALRAVQTTDFMTAHWAHLPHELLGRVSNRIINEVSGVNRVVYDISGKPPATIEWE